MFENGKTNAMDNYSAEKLLFISSSTYIFEKGRTTELKHTEAIASWHLFMVRVYWQQKGIRFAKYLSK